MTAKMGHNYYKGNRVGALGEHTGWGSYKIDYNRVRTYVVPKNLNDSSVHPLVSLTEPLAESICSPPFTADKTSIQRRKGGQRIWTTHLFESME